MAKKHKGYISDIDLALAAFDKAYPLSTAQKSEIEKYNKIIDLRDNSRLKESATNDTDEIWENF